MPDTPIPQGPFFNGINRTIDRTLVKNGLWDAQGVIQVERGRWAACWEGTSAKATFPPLTTSWSTWVANTAYSLDDRRIPNGGNGYLYMCVTAGTSHASTEPTWPKVIGATVTDNTVTWKCIAIDDTDGNAATGYAPQSVIYWRNNGALFAANGYKGCMASGTVPLITPARAQATTYAVEYDGLLVVCRDKEPVRIFPNSNLSSSTMFNTGKLNGEHWEGWANGGGTPIVPYFSYFDSTITLNSTATANLLTAASVSAASGAHGSGVNMDTNNNEYATLAIRFKSDEPSFSNKNIVRGGLAISDMAGSGTANVIYSEIGQTTTVLANFYEQFKIRFGKNMQQVMGRFPAVYRNRLCIVEGREYDYSLLNHGGSPTTTGSVGSYLEVDGDLTEGIAVGDEFIYFRSTSSAVSVSASVTNGSTSVTLASNQSWYTFDPIAIQADDGTVFYTRAANDTSGGASTALVLEDAYTGSTDASVTCWLRPGDSAAESNVKDYVLSRRNAKVMPIVGLSYNSPTVGDTRIQTTTSANYDNLATTAATFWATRRRLTAEQRRTVYFAGREAATSSSISEDGTDVTTWPTSASVVVGVASDGDITGLFAQADDRLLVCLEGAIYEIRGQPPIGSVIPSDFTVNPPKIASVGVQNNACIVADNSGQIIYFATPQGQIMRLVGGTISSPPISSAVESHPFWPTAFKQMQFVDNRLYCLEDSNEPVIWIFDTLSPPGYEWSYTFRVNSGVNQRATSDAKEIGESSYGGEVTATGSSVSVNTTSVTLGSAKTWRKRSVVYITDDNSVVRRYFAANAGTSSTSLTLDRPYEGSTDSSVTVAIYPGNRLYQTGDHGGIFAPYKNVNGQTDVLLGAYYNSTNNSDFEVRTINDRANKHNYASLCHGVRVQTGYETAGLRQIQKVVRTVSVLDTRPMAVSSNNPQDRLATLRVEISNSEGRTILSRNCEPDDRVGSTQTMTEVLDATYYECQGSGGVGDAAVTVAIGDGISSLPGELAECQILFRAKGRYR